MLRLMAGVLVLMTACGDGRDAGGGPDSSNGGGGGGGADSSSPPANDLGVTPDLSTVDLTPPWPSGLYAPPTSLNQSTSPTQIFLADCDDDGDLDLLIMQVRPHDYPSVLLRLGDGMGGFAAPGQTLWTGTSNTFSVQAFATVGDVNGDGKIDLVIRENYDTVITTLVRSGAATFTTHTSDPGVVALGMTLGDLDGDMKADLLLGTGSAITAYLSDGMGGYTMQGQMPVTLPAYRPDVFDLDGDGKLDVFMASGADVRWAAGTGTGSFGAPQTVTALAMGHRMVRVAPGDFNGDGKVDLAVVGFDPAALGPVHSLVFVPGTGAGLFAAPVAPATIARDVTAILAFDLDGNGTKDVAVMSGDTSGAGQYGLYVALGSTMGLGTPTRYPLQLHHSLNFRLDLEAADLTGDSKPELVVSGDTGALFGNGDVVVLRGLSANRKRGGRCPRSRAAMSLGCDLLVANPNP